MRTGDTRESIIRRRGYRKDIQGDIFSLYITNYPVTALYLGNRIGDKDKVLVELCCGIGGTLEYVAEKFKHVIGIDIDETRVGQCVANLKSVGLSQKATVVLGDIEDDSIIREVKADIAIYDVPFWMPYESERHGDLTKKNPMFRSTIKRIRKFICEDIVIYCPPEYDYEMVKGHVGPCEYQRVSINGRHDRNLVYLGSLKLKDGITELRLTI